MNLNKMRLTLFSICLCKEVCIQNLLLQAGISLLDKFHGSVVWVSGCTDAPMGEAHTRYDVFVYLVKYS